MKWGGGEWGQGLDRSQQIFLNFLCIPSDLTFSFPMFHFHSFPFKLMQALLKKKMYNFIFVYDLSHSTQVAEETGFMKHTVCRVYILKIYAEFRIHDLKECLVIFYETPCIRQSPFPHNDHDKVSEDRVT